MPWIIRRRADTKNLIPVNLGLATHMEQEPGGHTYLYFGTDDNDGFTLEVDGTPQEIMAQAGIRVIQLPALQPAYLTANLNQQEKTDMSTATLTWVMPTTRVPDGSNPPVNLLISEIANAKVYDSGALTPSVPIATVAAPAVTFTTETLSVGVHEFTVVMADTAGQVSGPSNVASVTVPAVVPTPTTSPPSPATGLTAVLNP
jgi:hypothetical protein